MMKLLTQETLGKRCTALHALITLFIFFYHQRLPIFLLFTSTILQIIIYIHPNITDLETSHSPLAQNSPQKVPTCTNSWLNYLYNFLCRFSFTIVPSAITNLCSCTCLLFWEIRCKFLGFLCVCVISGS